MYKVNWARQAKKDYAIALKNGYEVKVVEILNTLREKPLAPEPPNHCFEPLKGNLKGMYSRRMDYSNRFVYSVFPNVDGLKNKNGDIYEGIVLIDSMWGHPY